MKTEVKKGGGWAHGDILACPEREDDDAVERRAGQSNRGAERGAVEVEMTFDGCRYRYLIHCPRPVSQVGIYVQSLSHGSGGAGRGHWDSNTREYVSWSIYLGLVGAYIELLRTYIQ